MASAPQPLSPMLLKLMAHMRRVSPEPAQLLGLAAWRDDFRLWGESDADARHEGQGNWVSPIYIDFCTWLVGRGAQTCSRETFVRLLREEGEVLVTDGEISGLHPRFHRRFRTALKKTATTCKSGKRATR